MKSEIKYRQSTSQSVVGTYTKMINEWEVATGRGGETFSIIERSERVTLSVQRSCGSDLPWLPQLIMNKCYMGAPSYNLTGYVMGDDNLRVEFDFDFNRVHIVVWGDTPGTVNMLSELNDILGVDDILDVQPHEYGLLRLKYNYKGGVLFIPEEVKSLIRERGMV